MNSSPPPFRPLKQPAHCHKPTGTSSQGICRFNSDRHLKVHQERSRPKITFDGVPIFCLLRCYCTRNDGASLLQCRVPHRTIESECIDFRFHVGGETEMKQKSTGRHTVDGIGREWLRMPTIQCHCWFADVRGSATDDDDG